jgi:intein/homing endonuclease
MQVYTRHENKDVWGNYPVIGVKPGRDLRWKIDFEDGRQFVGTFNHPLHTQDRGWVEIRDLKIGDQITEPGGTFAVVKSAIEDGQGDIIKITVEDAHTYLTEGFLSHNKDYSSGFPIEED